MLASVLRSTLAIDTANVAVYVEYTDERLVNTNQLQKFTEIKQLPEGNFPKLMKSLC